MSHSNLPYTPFHHSGGSQIAGVSRVARDERTALGEHQHEAMTHSIAERIVRRRTLTDAQAREEERGWRDGGATHAVAPEGWRVWERRRGDAVSGGQRLQRLAVSEAAPHEVVNWSAPLPLSRADQDHWAGLLEPRADGGSAGEVPFMGWTA